jgi:hypothetical protein
MGAGCGVRPKRARSRGQARFPGPPVNPVKILTTAPEMNRLSAALASWVIALKWSRENRARVSYWHVPVQPSPGSGSSNAIAKYIARAPVKNPKSKSPPDGRRASFASRLLLRDDKWGTPTRSSSFKTRTCRRGLHRVSGYPSTERSQLWC